MANKPKSKSSSAMHFCKPYQAMDLSRRQLLRYGSQLTAFMTAEQLVKPSLLFAQSENSDPVQRKLVWIMMNGGWDILETIEPKPVSTSGIDVVYDWGLAHQIVGGGPQDKLGRWMPQVAALGEHLVAVRGLVMGTTSHTAGRVYMDTGILSNSGEVNVASIPVIVASQSQATIPMIQLAGGMEALTDRATNNVSVVRAQNLELYRSMYPANSAELQQKLKVLEHLRGSAERASNRFGTHDRLTDVINAEAKIRGQFEANVRDQLVLVDADRTPFMTGGPMNLNNNMVESFAMALKLLKNDLATSLSLGVGGFDTHSNQTPRMQPIMENFDFILATFVQELINNQLLDSTLIVVVSDFGRTPKINNGNGRDHWPVGGAMMLGGGIQGGRVVGGSDDNMRALAINEQTGALDPNGVQINASHLGGSVVELCLGSDFYQDKRSGYLTSIAALTQLKGSS